MTNRRTRGSEREAARFRFTVRAFRRFWLRVHVWEQGSGPGPHALNPDKDRASICWETSDFRWKLCDIHLIEGEATNASTLHHELSHLLPYMRRRFLREGHRLTQEAIICVSERIFLTCVDELRAEGLWAG